MTDTAKLALAMEAIEAADKALPNLLTQLDMGNNKHTFCSACRDWLNDTKHGNGCSYGQYLELRKKLEESRC